MSTMISLKKRAVILSSSWISSFLNLLNRVSWPDYNFKSTMKNRKKRRSVGFSLKTLYIYTIKPFSTLLTKH